MRQLGQQSVGLAFQRIIPIIGGNRVFGHGRHRCFYNKRRTVVEKKALKSIIQFAMDVEDKGQITNAVEGGHSD